LEVKRFHIENKIQTGKEQNLKESIHVLENDDKGDLQILEMKKREQGNIRLQKLKGSIIRSKGKWVEEVEKPTKYFLNLENRNFVSKLVAKVEKDNGEIVSNQEEIKVL